MIAFGEDISLYEGDCRELLASLPGGSVDAVVTDPPYELGFMGRQWDSTGIAFDIGLWREVLRVLKPGGHALVFAASRTYHRLACAMEDAGFEIRDQIDWVYASGMPHGSDAAMLVNRERLNARKGQPSDTFTQLPVIGEHAAAPGGSAGRTVSGARQSHP